MFLAAASQRTKNIRLGFGVMHLPPPINHPARIAERVATLDHLSNGRVEFGTGEGSSVAELGGFDIDPADKRTMWEEALEVSIRCMTEAPFTGFKGEHVQMPARNVVPKPLQSPHPPVWVACTRPSSVQMAAQKAIGALSFAYTGPEALKERVDGYYKEFEEQGTPVTPAINPNLLAIGGDLSMMVAKTDEEALKRIGIGGGFFSFGIMHYYINGMHIPGRTGVWELYENAVKDDPTLAYGPGRGRSVLPIRCANSCVVTRPAVSTRSSCCSTRAATRARWNPSRSWARRSCRNSSNATRKPSRTRPSAWRR